MSSDSDSDTSSEASVQRSDHGAGGFGPSAGFGGDYGCRVCHEAGHVARECPNKPALTCHFCKEEGHIARACPTKPPMTCRICNNEDHLAKDCPDRPPMECRFCKGNHMAKDCTAPRRLDFNVEKMSASEAWEKLMVAASTPDLTDFTYYFKVYAIALQKEGSKFDLVEFETSLRDQDKKVYTVGLKKKIRDVDVIVLLDGSPEGQFVVTFHMSPDCIRGKLKKAWPKTPEENLERLATAGFVMDRGVTKCHNCGELGHPAKYCKKERVEPSHEAATVRCYNCREEGHRARDCTQPRVNPNACRNCGQDGHRVADCTEERSAANVECRRCNQLGHFAKDCPTGGSRGCRNCDSEEHMVKDCPLPVNMERVRCRNCDDFGHFSRQCPKPTDWSKVRCRRCSEFGHTEKRCTQPAEAEQEWGNTTDIEPPTADAANSDSDSDSD